MTIELGDVPTWLSALATGGAWIAALTSIRMERRARTKLEQEATRREDQSQAIKVSAWFGGRSNGALQDSLLMLNRSDAPVYNVVVTMVLAQGAGPQRSEDFKEGLQHLRGSHIHCLTTLPPGLWKVAAPEGWAGMMRRPAAEIAFTDAAGLHWVRRAKGQLERLGTEPYEHLGVPLPINLQAPVPADA